MSRSFAKSCFGNQASKGYRLKIWHTNSVEIFTNKWKWKNKCKSWM